MMANSIDNDSADFVHHPQVRHAGARQELRERQFGDEGGSDGEESEDDGGGDIATVRVEQRVELLERTGSVGGAQGGHVFHAVDDLVEDEEDL